VGFFAFFGFVRGFVRAISGALGGLLAVISTVFVLPSVYVMCTPLVGTSLWSFVVVACVVFFAFLMLCFFAGDWLVSLVRAGPLRLVDNLFGLVLGVLRGLVFVGIAYWLFATLVPDLSQRDVVAESRALPHLQDGIVWVRTAARDWIETSDFVAFAKSQLNFLDDAVDRSQQNMIAEASERSPGLQPQEEGEPNAAPG
jgi:uncharacterized membrane protein required for colicin V production